MHPVYDELVEFNHLEMTAGQTFSLCLTVLTYDTFTRDEIVGEMLVPIGSEHFDAIEQILTYDITARRQQVLEKKNKKHSSSRTASLLPSWQVNSLARCLSRCAMSQPIAY